MTSPNPNVFIRADERRDSQAPVLPRSPLRSLARWLLALVLLACLVSLNPNVPTWSNTGVAGGALVASGIRYWFSLGADLLYFWFGASAWLLLLACFRLRLWSSSAAEPERGQRGANHSRQAHDAQEPPMRRLLKLWGVNLALLLFIAACCMLDAMGPRLLAARLPGPPGGVLGAALSGWLSSLLGWALAQLVVVVVWTLSLSLALRFSWLVLAERVGNGLEAIIHRFRLRFDTVRDAKAGHAATLERMRALGQVPGFDLAATHAAGTTQHANATDADLLADTVATAATATTASEPSVSATAPSTSDALSTGSAPSTANALTAAPGNDDSPSAELHGEPLDANAPLEGDAHALESLDLSHDAAAQAVVLPAVPAGVMAVPLAPRPATPVRIEPVLDDNKAPAPNVAARQQNLFLDQVVGAQLPPLGLLKPAQERSEAVSHETLEYQSRLIEKKLSDFGVQARVVAAYPGPVITRYEIEPAKGVKGSQIVNLSKDLARSLSKLSVRVIETIPGKEYMALELPNVRRDMIRLSEVLGSKVYADSSSKLTVALGKDNVGKPMVVDLAKMPHLLVAGTTGSGKSVGINAMILSLLYKAQPSEVRLILIDPKMLEMSTYEGIPHLLCPVVTDMKQAANALNWAVGEMERRYKLMSKHAVRNIGGFNQKIKEAAERGTFLPNPFSLTPESPEPLQHMPYIVIIIDELADLMMVVGKKIEELIARLAQKARAAGIHLILATQRPSVDVITGLIKANVPTRIAFQVSSKVDSRTILDQMGAEALLGQGDMLFLAPGTGFPQRVHGAFVEDEEVVRVAEALRATSVPDYIEGILEGGTLDDEEGGVSPSGEGGDGESDPLYDQAVQVVVSNKRASISLVQRHLRIGYNRAARLLEQMERSGIVSAMNHTGGRDILVPKREE